MVRDYELMFIVRPDVDDDGLRASVDSVKTLVEGQGGEVTKTTMWGKRRLAYEVQHLRDGHYVIAELRLDGSKVAAVERALRIHDTVFRHLLVVQEAPLAEAEGAEGDGLDGNGTERAATATAPAATEAAKAAEAPEATASDTEETTAQTEAEPEPDTESDEDTPAAADEEE